MSANEATLTELIQELRSKQRDLTEYVDELCDHVERVEPDIRALIPETDRRGRLQTAAASHEQRFPPTGERPPLYGVPVGIKDIVHVDGFPTRAGSDVPPHRFGGPQASIVTNLREAGAIVLGKTVTTEFARSEPGPTRNPNDLDHTPGGSSSGSVAAVAAGMCPLAIGSQTNGSVIRPASFCGIVGFKPSYGRIPIDGVVMVSPSADHLGLFTRTVADLRAAAPIACQDWNESDAGSDRRPTLGVTTGPYLEQADLKTRDEFETWIAALKDAGYEVKRVTAFDDIEAVNRQQTTLVAGEFALEREQFLEDHEDALRDGTVERVREGFDVTAKDLAEARRHRVRVRENLAATMDREGIDLWLSPAAPGPAPEGIDDTGDPVMNKPWTHAGVPVVTVPAGSIDDLPVGLQIAGPYMADEALLSWAASLETALQER